MKKAARILGAVTAAAVAAMAVLPASGKDKRELLALEQSDVTCGGATYYFRMGVMDKRALMGEQKERRFMGALGTSTGDPKYYTRNVSGLTEITQDGAVHTTTKIEEKGGVFYATASRGNLNTREATPLSVKNDARRKLQRLAAGMLRNAKSLATEMCKKRKPDDPNPMRLDVKHPLAQAIFVGFNRAYDVVHAP
ncbi:MAG: hypothetical protein HY053_01505 [Proteobacteria bacterium]|nr:hypothetical protein [Pseudomonadota bacterium]